MSAVQWLSVLTGFAAIAYIARHLERRPSKSEALVVSDATPRVRSRLPGTPLVLALVECVECGATVPCRAQLRTGWIGDELEVEPLETPRGWILAIGPDGMSVPRGLCPSCQDSRAGRAPASAIAVMA